MEKKLNQPQKISNSTGGPTRIALIGCGAIAENYYLPALASHPQVMQCLTLVDQNLDRVRDMAATFGVKQYVTDYHDVLENTNGAIIALPTHLHHPISMEFISRGIHVLCDKPLAESAKKAMEMVDAASQSGSILAVNYLQRLIPTFAKVKEWVSTKKYGELLSIHYHVGEEFDWPSVSGFYFNSPVSGRGILRDRGAHVMDHICWWLGGKPKLISSKNDAFGGSEAVAYVQFDHLQCTGEVMLSWLGAFPSQYKLVFEKATVLGDVYDYQNIWIEHSNGKTQQIHLNSREKNKLDIAKNVVFNFLDVIEKGNKPLVSGSDVLDSIELIDDCYLSATRFNMPWYDIPQVQNAW